jgi:hypothetical protein
MSLDLIGVSVTSQPQKLMSNGGDNDGIAASLISNKMSALGFRALGDTPLLMCNRKSKNDIKKD